MRLLFIDHIDNAYRTLRRNQARSVLTTLGIAIGVASITCILAISGGVQQVIEQQVAPLSNKLLIVRPGQQTRDPNALTNPMIQQSFSTSTLTETDVEVLRKLPSVATVVPIMTINGTMRSSNQTVKDNMVLATVPEFKDIADITMKAGGFLDEKTDNTTAVIGEDLALELFETDQAIGQQFTIRGQSFTVIGVVKRNAQPINYNGVDVNRAAIVSFEQGKLFHQGRAQIQQINLLAKKPETLQKTTNQARTTLLNQHLGEEDFTIVTGAAITEPTSLLFRAVTDVMVAIAAISLFVGGVGVMNIMLVGVAERTREIGIRKAVGASNNTIILQFIIESLMMSLLGGLVGYLLGYAAAFIISMFLFFAPAFTWHTAAAAVAMAVATGVLFGIFPALKAARKDTIESLRQYH